MATITLNPHYLLIQKKGTAPYEDENGDYVPGTSAGWEKVCKCDIVPNGEAQTIQLEDGTQKEYAYVVYLPKECEDIELGTLVKFEAFGKQSKEHKVLGFHRYQLQCKLWV
jgi:hypothetical protein